MAKKNQEIKINSEFITLGQLLKLLKIVSSGGEVKNYLQNHKITVNNNGENRRGRKLYPNDILEIESCKITIK